MAMTFSQISDQDSQDGAVLAVEMEEVSVEVVALEVPCMVELRSTLVCG